MGQHKNKRKTKPAMERAWPRVSVEPNGCWSFNGAHSSGGYAQVRSCGVATYLHRLMYEHFIGPIPEGLMLDHEKCDNPGCVNPYHLVPKTNRENSIRGNHPYMVAHRNRTCAKGHAISGDNAYHRPSGHVRCRICQRDTRRRRTAKAKELHGDWALLNFPEAA